MERADDQSFNFVPQRVQNTEENGKEQAREADMNTKRSTKRDIDVSEKKKNSKGSNKTIS